MTEHAWHVVHVDPSNRPDVNRACAAVLAVLRDRIGFVVIDAYSDYAAELTPEGEAAQAELRARGSRRRRGDPGMGIELDPHDEAAWALFSAYAPWSIQAELWERRYIGDLGTFHDSGLSITVNLTADERERLVTILGPSPEVHLLPPRRRWFGRWRRERR